MHQKGDSDLALSGLISCGRGHYVLLTYTPDVCRTLVQSAKGRE